MNHHYYVTTALGWGKGTTLAEALVNAAKASGISKTPLYACSYLVLAPKDTQYRIEFFMPQGVELADRREWMIQNSKGFVLPIESETE